MCSQKRQSEQTASSDTDDPKHGHGENFYGVIKSYNERRGFGFVVCEETAKRFGRDVYLSKEEAMILAQEPAVGLAATDASAALGCGGDGGGATGPPVREGDFLMFQVQSSTEGFPQAMAARRIRRLRGVVVRAPIARADVDGVIIVRGDADESKDCAAKDKALLRLLAAEVRVRQAECGQLRLMPDDVVAFCCTRAADDGSGHALEAQLVELLSTTRSSGSLFGCFSLEFPRTVEGDDKSGEGGVAVLSGHALSDRVVLAGLPRDMGVPELMRLFGKLHAVEGVVTYPNGADDHDACGFASVSFSCPEHVGRFLARATHTISEQGATQLAHVGPCRRRRHAGAGNTVGDVASLPALPRPTLQATEDGALLVQWSQVNLAAGYLVELRPIGDSSPWCSVAAATGQREVNEDGLPEGLLGPTCTACRVNSLRGDVPFEARIAYFAACGCGSQPSVGSIPCIVPKGVTDGEAAPSAKGSPSPPAVAAFQETERTLDPAELAEEHPKPVVHEVPLQIPPSQHSPLTHAGDIMNASSVLDALAAPIPPVAVGPHPPYGHSSFLDGSAGLHMPLPAPQPIFTPQGPPPLPEWRCVHGSLVPSAAAPELVPAGDNGRSICIQWPMVIHATAYTVELFEEATSSSERFTRAVPEGMAEALVELRVGNLHPGVYAACIRCVAPCGCESTPSPWSFLPPAWLPPTPSAQPPYMASSWQPSTVHPAYMPSSPMPVGAPPLPPRPPPAPPTLQAFVQPGGSANLAVAPIAAPDPSAAAMSAASAAIAAAAAAGACAPSMPTAGLALAPADPGVAAAGEALVLD
eukprot:TRINITY_DN48441_c0_g1_i1.p1 TRINITY_DN48441_c0_g1~~TRINITY_DN48441_c0_g1_i1.p1  ORF type:complete len:812 (-),score=131.48 TRINITY_DN48441_c0_g1_i1:296-2731(-)